MDDLNITMKEYIRLEEEKPQSRGDTFNWQTATFGRMEHYYEEESFTNFEAEFLAIVFGNTNTTLSDTKQGMTMEEYDTKREDFEVEFPAIVLNNPPTSEATHSYEPTISPPDENKIDFRISLDESDDEDYTVIFDENSFLYKIISINDLKTDSENDTNNILLSPKPTVDYLDDLDFFNKFDNEFLAIVYNDGLTSKPDLETEPPVSSKHINEFETSLPGYDEEERNNLYFNDVFPFNVVHLDDLKLEKDNDENGIDIIQSLWDMAPLPHRNLRHQWLRYHIEEYIKDIVYDFERRIRTIWDRSVNRVYILNFEGLTPKMRQDSVMRLRMVYTGGVRRSMTWRQFILALGLHTEQEMAHVGFRAYWTQDPVRRLCHMMIACTTSSHGQGLEKVTGVDLFYLRTMDRGTANVPYLLAQYLFRHAKGKKSGARLSEGHFIGCLTEHFGLAWVASGPERQQAAAAGTYEGDKGGPAVEEAAQDIPAPIQRSRHLHPFLSPGLCRRGSRG
nr:hypothetical protein [Tanacetum cinerariifolium]